LPNLISHPLHLVLGIIPLHLCCIEGTARCCICHWSCAVFCRVRALPGHVHLAMVFKDRKQYVGDICIAGSVSFLVGSMSLVYGTFHKRCYTIWRKSSALFWGSASFLVGSILFLVDSIFLVNSGDDARFALLVAGLTVFLIGGAFFLCGSTTDSCDVIF
jgi:uncharacterized membrane protein YdcZ (DUF606 family)